MWPSINFLLLFSWKIHMSRTLLMVELTSQVNCIWSERIINTWYEAVVLSISDCSEPCNLTVLCQNLKTIYPWNCYKKYYFLQGIRIDPGWLLHLTKYVSFHFLIHDTSSEEPKFLDATQTISRTPIQVGYAKGPCWKIVFSDLNSSKVNLLPNMAHDIL